MNFSIANFLFSCSITLDPFGPSFNSIINCWVIYCHIDRALINNNWLFALSWQHPQSLGRSLSDHCPITLENNVKDWGPKLFRFINAWHSHSKFRHFVKEKWRSYKVEGWGSFILKEKFKRLKADLKAWNKEVFDTLDKKIEKRIQEIQELDILDEVFVREKHGAKRRNEQRVFYTVI